MPAMGCIEGYVAGDHRRISVLRRCSAAMWEGANHRAPMCDDHSPRAVHYKYRYCTVTKVEARLEVRRIFVLQ